MKKDRLPHYLFNNFFFKFVNNFEKLFLYKINVFDIFDRNDFFQTFVTSRSTKILIESKFRATLTSPSISLKKIISSASTVLYSKLFYVIHSFITHLQVKIAVHLRRISL